jgi:hypothetical protein
MGLTGISQSTVLKLCKDIDERVGAFLDRRREGDWPYLRLDAIYLRQREGGRVVSVDQHQDCFGSYNTSVMSDFSPFLAAATQ